MEPVSVAASCVGIIDAFTKTSCWISDLVNTARCTNEDLEQTYQHLKDLQKLLASLDQDPNDPQESRAEWVTIPDQVKSLRKACLKDIHHLKSTLKKYSQGSLRQAKWALKGKGEVGKLRDNLKDSINALYLAVLASTHVAVHAVGRDTAHIPGILQRTVALQEDISQMRMEIQLSREVGSSTTSRTQPPDDKLPERTSSRVCFYAFVEVCEFFPFDSSDEGDEGSEAGHGSNTDSKSSEGEDWSLHDGSDNEDVVEGPDLGHDSDASSQYSEDDEGSGQSTTDNEDTGEGSEARSSSGDSLNHLEDDEDSSHNNTDNEDSDEGSDASHRHDVMSRASTGRSTSTDRKYSDHDGTDDETTDGERSKASHGSMATREVTLSRASRRSPSYPEAAACGFGQDNTHSRASTNPEFGQTSEPHRMSNDTEIAPAQAWLDKYPFAWASSSTHIYSFTPTGKVGRIRIPGITHWKTIPCPRSYEWEYIRLSGNSRTIVGIPRRIPRLKEGARDLLVWRPRRGKYFRQTLTVRYWDVTMSFDGLYLIAYGPRGLSVYRAERSSRYSPHCELSIPTKTNIFDAFLQADKPVVGVLRVSPEDTLALVIVELEATSQDGPGRREIDLNHKLDTTDLVKLIRYKDSGWLGLIWSPTQGKLRSVLVDRHEVLVSHAVRTQQLRSNQAPDRRRKAWCCQSHLNVVVIAICQIPASNKVTVWVIKEIERPEYLTFYRERIFESEAGALFAPAFSADLRFIAVEFEEGSTRGTTFWELPAIL